MNIYTVGTIGRGGYPVNCAGGALFEPTDNGEFGNKRGALRCAAELARMWSLDNDGEPITVGVVSGVRDSGNLQTLIATATATGRRVRWS